MADHYPTEAQIADVERKLASLNWELQLLGTQMKAADPRSMSLTLTSTGTDLIYKGLAELRRHAPKVEAA